MINNFKFQEQEHIDELALNWDSFKWRNHQPEIGRFFNVDPLAEKYYYNSPYAFSENKVVAHRELEGLESWSINDQQVSNVKATPTWNGEGEFTGYDVSFTLEQQTTNYINDESNVVTRKEEITSVSTHTMHLTRGGAPTFLPANTPKVDRQNATFMKSIPVKGSIATVTTKTTPVSLNGERKVKPTITVTKQNTGTVTLTAENTKKIKDEQERQEPSVVTKFIHSIILGKQEQRNNKNVVGPPDR